MKIYGSIFVLLGAARLATSQSSVPQVPYPSCINKLCYTTGASSFCPDASMKCMCQTSADMFFLYIYYCAGIYCSESDVKEVLAASAAECKNAGYDASGVINSLLDSSIPTDSFSYPTVSFPLESNSPLFTDSPTGTKSGTSSSGSAGSSSDSGSGKGGMSTGAIIGIVVGGVFVIGIIAGLIVFCTKHRAKERRRQAMSAAPPSALAPPPPPAPIMSPPPMSQYSTPAPPAYPPYTPPIYPPQQQIFQQQQQPLMQGYQDSSTAHGYYVPPQKEADQKPVSVATTTPASPPPNASREYFQELAGDYRPRPAPVDHTPAPIGRTLAQEDHVYVEMPANSRGQ